MMSKPRVCLDDESAENDKASEVEECGPFQENFCQQFVCLYSVDICTLYDTVQPNWF